MSVADSAGVTFAAIEEIRKAVDGYMCDCGTEVYRGPVRENSILTNLAALQALAEAADAAYERALRIWPAPKMLSREMQELGEKVARVQAGAREEQG